MESVGIIALFSLLFAGSHIVLATSRIRAVLVDRLGRWGFTALYCVIAWVTFGILVLYYTDHRFEGPQALGLVDVAAVRWMATALISLGVILMAGMLSPSAYPDSPMALFVSETRRPRGLERITRHPFFYGAVLFSVGHIFLAVKLASVVFFAGIALLGVLGGWHQDQKLRGQKGAAYAIFVRESSALPFLAIVQGRQKLVLRELPWVFMALGGGAVWGFYSAHGSGFAATAEVVIAVLVAVPVALLLTSWIRNRRRAVAARWAGTGPTTRGPATRGSSCR